MVGKTQYTREQIQFVMNAFTKFKGPRIQEMYRERFGKDLTSNQLRYLKSKYYNDGAYQYV